MSFLLYPVLLLKFWYVDAPLAIIAAERQVATYFLHFLSIPLLARTFFRPLKNEYRKNFILFSIIFGMVVKTFLLIVTTLMIIGVVMVELLALVIFLVFPVVSLYFLIS